MGVHRRERTEAGRIAVRAQLLDARRPTDLLAVVRQLTLRQIDPTAAVAPSADLVALESPRVVVPAGLGDELLAVLGSEAIHEHRSELRAAFHCVTTWSLTGLRWEGAPSVTLWQRHVAHDPRASVVGFLRVRGSMVTPRC